MKLRSLRLRNFRNHGDSRLEFGDAVNVLLGGNGQGKTNVLEAISYFGLAKSFYAASDGIALKLGEKTFEIEGTISGEAAGEQSIAIRYDGESGVKEIMVNRIRLEKIHLLIGRFPVVMLSPESGRITSGPPAERRKFLDLALTQQSRVYFEDLLEYRRALKQRNNLLAEAREGGAVSDDLLAPWTQRLVQIGSRIVCRRREFVKRFQKVVEVVYRTLSGNTEEVSIQYKTTQGVSPEADTAGIADGLESEFLRARSEEIRRGITLVGPHRDDLLMTIDSKSVQAYASQGQHKTLLLAMKSAEFNQICEQRGEIPVLLLDDLFGDLDAERSERIMDAVSGFGQSIITATGDYVFRNIVQWNGNNRRFSIENGTCTPR